MYICISRYHKTVRKRVSFNIFTVSLLSNRDKLNKLFQNLDDTFQVVIKLCIKFLRLVEVF